MGLVCTKFHEIWNILSKVIEQGTKSPPRGMARPKRHGADRVKYIAYIDLAYLFLQLAEKFRLYFPKKISEPLLKLIPNVVET